MRFMIAFALLLSPLLAERRVTPIVQMTYPQRASSARVQGVVVLNVTVDKDGAIQTIGIISGHPMLVEDAVSKTKIWQFSPATAGDPETATLTITWEYRLDQSINGTRVEFNPMTNSVTLTAAAPLAQPSTSAANR